MTGEHGTARRPGGSIVRTTPMTYRHTPSREFQRVLLEIGVPAERVAQLAGEVSKP